MTNEQIRKLEIELWYAADKLRANSKLTAAEYKDPVLGLIFLRFAQNRFEEVKDIVEKSIPESPRGKRKPAKDDYVAAGAMMLVKEASYEYLVDLPEDNDICQSINDAMKKIEKEYPDLQGVLPKNYQEIDPELLRELIRIFNKDAVKKATGDIFGRIYEYFLMKFSMQGAGAQEGGEFFTPPSLVRLIVHFIEPEHGVVYDPACGSGGMFVQTGYFIKGNSNKDVNEAITVYGTEQKSNNVRLAKMNLAVHGIEGQIVEGNSYYSDSFDLNGKCDFLMANPPFNVNGIDKKKEFVKNDPRLPFGLPKTDNGNYMWIQYFMSYLNEKGRAGFVMASSATDAGHSEKLIREQLVDSGNIDCIVSISNNFFYTRTLPCHLWFFDKDKKMKNSNKILMLDARNVFRKVTTTLNVFSFGQLNGLKAIMKMYRGDNKALADYNNLVQGYASVLLEKLNEKCARFHESVSESAKKLKIDNKLLPVLTIKLPADPKNITIEEMKAITNYFSNNENEFKKLIETMQAEAGNGTKDKKYKQMLATFNKALKVYKEDIKEEIDEIIQLRKDRKWIDKSFPEGKYQDVEGLCKIVSLEEVHEQDYSLTPGRYVGVALEIDEDFDYQGRMKEIHEELSKLNTEADKLQSIISSNFKELGL